MSALSQRLHTMAGGLPRAFWFIWAGTFVMRCGSFVLPFLAIVLTQVHGLPTAQAGLVIALYGVGATIAGPLGGLLADRVGRRFTMLLALFGGGSSMIALGFATRVEVIAPAIFFIALVSEMYRPGMQAAVADLVPAHDRVRAFGLTYWVINLGWSVGLALGGILYGHSWHWLFIGDGLTTLLFGVIIAIGVPETRPARATTVAADGTVSHVPHESAWAGFLSPFRDRVFMLFVFLAFCFAVVFLQNATTFGLDMATHGIKPATYGLIIGLNGVLIVLIQPVLGPYLTRFDRSRTLAVGVMLAGLGFGMYAFVRTPLWYTLGVVLWTVGEICVLPVANAVVADLAPADKRGRYQGTYGLSWGFASAAAPALGMGVLSRYGATWLWSGIFALCVLVALGHLSLAPRLRTLRAARLAAGS